jgi:3-oxoacyl-[acyl-carrier protein] reductase
LDLGLKGKVALVLASSRGLGYACAKEFYREGANVVTCSRTEQDLRDAKHRIYESESVNDENEIYYVVADIMDEAQIEKVVRETMEKFGKIDILVHNAGGPPSGPVKSISKEQWENSIDLNLRSFIRIAYLVLPIMQEQGSGRIIAITSVSVKQPLENLVLSNTTRLGVVGFAKTLANEYGKDNILVNVVCSGPTLTDRMRTLISDTVERTGKSEEEVKKSWTDEIPMGRLGRPSELADLVVFLGSERASYINGAVIQVDGGFVKAPF